MMLQMTGYVMRVAPFAVFGAMAAVIADKGLDILVDFARLIGEFYLGLFILWVILLDHWCGIPEKADMVVDALYS